MKKLLQQMLFQNPRKWNLTLTEAIRFEPAKDLPDQELRPINQAITQLNALFSQPGNFTIGQLLNAISPIVKVDLTALPVTLYSPHINFLNFSEESILKYAVFSRLLRQAMPLTQGTGPRTNYLIDQAKSMVEHVQVWMDLVGKYEKSRKRAALFLSLALPQILREMKAAPQTQGEGETYPEQLLKRIKQLNKLLSALPQTEYLLQIAIKETGGYPMLASQYICLVNRFKKTADNLLNILNTAYAITLNASGKEAYDSIHKPALEAELEQTRNIVQAVADTNARLDQEVDLQLKQKMIILFETTQKQLSNYISKAPKGRAQSKLDYVTTVIQSLAHDDGPSFFESHTTRALYYLLLTARTNVDSFLVLDGLYHNNGRGELGELSDALGKKLTVFSTKINKLSADNSAPSAIHPPP